MTTKNTHQNTARTSRRLIAGLTGLTISMTACGGSGFGSESAGRYDTSEARLAGYIDSCINSSVRQINNSADDYFEWTSPNDGPTLDTAFNGMRPINTLELCATVVDAAGDSSDEVDVAAVAFFADAEALADLVDTAQIYYSTKNYETDDLAEGLELHPQLVAAYDTTLASADTFVDIATEINDAQFAEDLEAAASGDRDVADLVQLTIAQAEAVIDSVVVDGFIVSSDAPELADPEALRTETLALRALIDEMKAAADEQGDDVGVFAYDGYERAVEIYIAEAELLQVRLDRPDFFTESEADSTPSIRELTADGTFEGLLDEWNNLVNTYNRLS